MSDDFNNNFNIVFRNNSGNVYQNLYFAFETCVGNPNVYNIRDELNVLLAAFCNITYDKIKNTFTFFRTKAQDNNFYKMYLKVVNCGTFLGFDSSYNNQEIEITSNGLESYQPINVIYHQQILFNMDGDIQTTLNNLDNKNNNVFKPSGVIFYKTVDVEPTKLLTYDNIDSNASFQYKLTVNEIINQINVNVTNQNGEDIPGFGDWMMTLQFTRCDEVETEKILAQIKEYISYLFIIIGNYIFGLK